MKWIILAFLCYTMTYEMNGKTYLCIVCPTYTTCERPVKGF